MRVLFFQWHSFLNKGIERALQSLGVSYDSYFYQFSDWEKDDEFLERFTAYLKKGGYGLVLSVNFSPLISLACETCGIPYVAWVYDSPVHIRDLSSMKRSCNRIYFFDRGQAGEYRKLGVDARHLPLAVDTEVFWEAAHRPSEKERWADISFVGQLYQTEYSYFTAPLPEYLRGYLEGIVAAQLKLYGGYLIPELVTEELLLQLNEAYRAASGGGFVMGKRELSYLLACETTGRERYLALALLSKRHSVDLYTADEDSRLKDVHYRGYADYYGKMPAVFLNSRINLNISLKTIRTGIPLRVLDCMGCMGFVISNYQEELLEHFSPGQDCEIYESLEDLCQKTDYYLKNEDARKRIAAAGFEKVKRDFGFRDRVRELLE